MHLRLQTDNFMHTAVRLQLQEMWLCVPTDEHLPGEPGMELSKVPMYMLNFYDLPTSPILGYLILQLQVSVHVRVRTRILLERLFLQMSVPAKALPCKLSLGCSTLQMRLSCDNISLPDEYGLEL